MRIRERALRILVKILIAVLALIVGMTITFVVLQVSKRNRLYGDKNNQGPNLDKLQDVIEQAEGADNATAAIDETADMTEEADDGWQEGDIRYQDKIYRYNEDILTFLFMGIDSMQPVRVVEDGIDGGQSDALFLLVLDPHAKQISVIAINRDTMTDIDVYSKQGAYMGTTKGQITLQHAYGDGAKISCERSVAAVQRLFYDLPIHGYASVNMGAIPLINDAIGGVEVTALEDVIGTKIREGQTITLQGMDAYSYLHNRDTKSFNSAGRRLDRQKQYITTYVKTAIEQMKSDITLPVNLYNTLSKYMVTDVTVDEVSYLAPQMLDYTFNTEHIYSLPGTTTEGEKFEEFYVEEKGLYELILKVFYEEVN